MVTSSSTPLRRDGELILAAKSGVAATTMDINETFKASHKDPPWTHAALVSPSDRGSVPKTATQNDPEIIMANGVS